MAQEQSTGKQTTAQDTADDSTEGATATDETTGAESAADETTGAESAAEAGAADSSGGHEPEASMRTAAAKARGAAEDVTIVMTSRVKDLLKELDMRVDSDLVHAVNERVQDMLTKAAERAKENQRKTVRPHDL